MLRRIAPMAARPWKENVKATDVAVANVFNTMFLILSVCDYSADLWTAAAEGNKSKMVFLAEYVAWRQAMPVLAPVLMLLLLPLPFIVGGMYLSMLQALLGWRAATMTRHVADCIEAATISVIVVMVVTRIIPTQTEVVASCPPASNRQDVVSQCTSAASDLQANDLIMVLLNLIMFVMPIVKYNKGNTDAAEAKPKAE